MGLGVSPCDKALAFGARIRTFVSSLQSLIRHSIDQSHQIPFASLLPGVFVGAQRFRVHGYEVFLPELSNEIISGGLSSAVAM